MYVCENCNSLSETHYGSGRFCSMKCAKSYSTSLKRKEINKKVSETLSNRKLSIEHRRNISNSQLNKVVKQSTREKISRSKSGVLKTEIEKQNIAAGMLLSKVRSLELLSILDISSRTMRKIFIRLGIGCSNCGWSEASCDVHHINGRKIENADSHNNLCYLCPNCHRLVHSGKLDKSNLITLADQIGDRWKDYYFG